MFKIKLTIKIKNVVCIWWLEYLKLFLYIHHHHPTFPSSFLPINPCYQNVHALNIPREESPPFRFSHRQYRRRINVWRSTNNQHWNRFGIYFYFWLKKHRPLSLYGWMENEWKRRSYMTVTMTTTSTSYQECQLIFEVFHFPRKKMRKMRWMEIQPIRILAISLTLNLSLLSSYKHGWSSETNKYTTNER